jgi:hypothetical protein
MTHIQFSKLLNKILIKIILILSLLTTPTVIHAVERWEAAASLDIETQFGIEKGRLEGRRRALSKKNRDLRLYSFYIISNSRQLYGYGQSAENRLAQELMSITTCRQIWGYLFTRDKETIIGNMMASDDPA